MSLYIRKKRVGASDPALGAPQTKKFTTGRLWWLPAGAADGYIDFGNVVDYKASPKRQRIEHLTSANGRKEADLSLVKSVSELKTFTLDEEFNQTLLLLALGTQHTNLVQPAALGVDSNLITSDNVNITADGTGMLLTAVINPPLPGRAYSLALQDVTITSAKDGNNANLVLGTDYALDAAAGMLTVLQAAPAGPWTFTYTWIAVTDLVFSALDNLLTTGIFRFAEYDQFNLAVPLAVETFSGQCYIQAWGDNNGEKFYEFTLEILITP